MNSTDLQVVSAIGEIVRVSLLSGEDATLPGLGLLSLSHVPSTTATDGRGTVVSAPATKLEFRPEASVSDESILRRAANLLNADPASVQTAWQNALNRFATTGALSIQGVGEFERDEASVRCDTNHALRQAINARYTGYIDLAVLKNSDHVGLADGYTPDPELLTAEDFDYLDDLDVDPVGELESDAPVVARDDDSGRSIDVANQTGRTGWIGTDADFERGLIDRERNDSAIEAPIPQPAPEPEPERESESWSRRQPETRREMQPHAEADNRPDTETAPDLAAKAETPESASQFDEPGLSTSFEPDAGEVTSDDLGEIVPDVTDLPPDFVGIFESTELSDAEPVDADLDADVRADVGADVRADVGTELDAELDAAADRAVVPRPAETATGIAPPPVAARSVAPPARKSPIIGYAVAVSAVVLLAVAAYAMLGRSGDSAPTDSSTEISLAEPTASAPEEEVQAPPPQPEIVFQRGAIDQAAGGFTIIVASKETESEAGAEAATIAIGDLPVDVFDAEVAGQTRYRVAVGQFRTFALASRALKQNAARLPDGSWIGRIE